MVRRSLFERKVSAERFSKSSFFLRLTILSPVWMESERRRLEEVLPGSQHNVAHLVGCDVDWKRNGCFIILYFDSLWFTMITIQTQFRASCRMRYWLKLKWTIWIRHMYAMIVYNWSMTRMHSGKWHECTWMCNGVIDLCAFVSFTTGQWHECI